MFSRPLSRFRFSEAELIPAGRLVVRTEFELELAAGLFAIEAHGNASADLAAEFDPGPLDFPIGRGLHSDLGALDGPHVGQNR